MKRSILLFIAVLMVIITAYSQEEDSEDIKTIFGEGSYGGFGGPVLKLSPVHEDMGLLIGGRGGWILDHSFVIGGGGYGLTTSSRFNGTGRHGNDTLCNLNMGYGGFMVEYILFPNREYHLSFPLLIGAGGVEIHEGRDYYDYSDYNYNRIEGGAYVIIEPGVNIELNLLEYFRMGFGASYRYIAGTHLTNVSDKDLSDVSFNLIFKFGLF